MKITRTANAGVLLELDGSSILLDGVCTRVGPYLPTPDPVLRRLTEKWPDAVCFTHEHPDHFLPDYAQSYEQQMLRPIIGPELLPVKNCVQEHRVGDVLIRCAPTRHLGKSEGISHGSIWIRGTKEILFTGDAAPLQIKKYADVIHPDVVLCPYAFATNATGWQAVKALGPKVVILLHFPPKDQDPMGLRQAAEEILQDEKQICVFIPEMEECINI